MRGVRSGVYCKCSRPQRSDRCRRCSWPLSRFPADKRRGSEARRRCGRLHTADRAPPRRDGIPGLIVLFREETGRREHSRRPPVTSRWRRSRGQDLATCFPMTNTTNAIQKAQAALHRRLSVSATRRFVAKAQEVLPRDGTVVQGNTRRLVAKMARCARKQGRTGNGVGEAAKPEQAPPPKRACRSHREPATCSSAKR